MGIRSRNFILGAAPFILFIIAWDLAVRFGWLPNWIIAPPLQVIKALANMVQDGTLLRLLYSSMLNIMPAYFIAMLVATVGGILCGMNATAAKIIRPILSSFHTIPSIAWLPLIVLFLGLTRTSIWVLIIIATFSRSIYIVISGVETIRKEWLLVAKNLNLNPFQTVIYVVVPAASTQILAGMRSGFGSAWRTLIGAEMLVTSMGGLGKYIWYAQWYYEFDRVIAGIVVIAVIGITVEQLIFNPLEKITVQRWGMANTENN